MVRGEGLTTTGTYEALFHIGDWYRSEGIALPTPAFLETVPYRFGVADLAQHYHLPLKMTPWGFSLFRGGA
jgi:5-hydroxyisourate hydrolase